MQVLGQPEHQGSYTVEPHFKKIKDREVVAMDKGTEVPSQLQL